MSNATTTTRTVLAITDASDSWGTTDLPESRIVELITAAAENYYCNRDDVVEFDVLERVEQYSNVQLPPNFNRAESDAINNAAWAAYCEVPVNKERGSIIDPIVRSTEVRRHNGQCEFGVWMPLEDQSDDVIDVVVDEVLEALCRDCRREEHSGNDEDGGRVTVGGQAWVYRR